MIDPDVLVIGYGNSIKGDDALGHVVAAEIERRVSDNTVRVVTAEILTTDLVPEVAEARLVIFLDASCQGTVGQVECRPVHPDCQSAASMAHTLSVGALLGFVQQFYHRVPETYLVTSPAADFELRDVQLSPEVQAVVPDMAARAIELIQAAGASSACRLQDCADPLELGSLRTVPEEEPRIRRRVRISTDRSVDIRIVRLIRGSSSGFGFGRLVRNNKGRRPGLDLEMLFLLGDRMAPVRAVTRGRGVGSPVALPEGEAVLGNRSGIDDSELSCAG